MITFEDSYTNVDCLLMDFDVDQGVAKSNLLVADGPTLKIEGEATVNLGLETIDMVLLPKQKQGFYTHISSVKIDGPLRDPSVHTSAGKAAFVGVGGLALIPEVVVPLGLIDMLWKKLFSSNKGSTGCTELVAKYREQQKKAAAQKTD